MKRTHRRSGIVLAAAAAVTVAVLSGGGTAGAQAFSSPPCAPGQPAARLVNQTDAVIEGLAVDGQGRLYIADLRESRVLRIDAPGEPAEVLATLPEPGGAGALAWQPDGTLLVGTRAAGGPALGDVFRFSGIDKINIGTGEVTTFVESGLSAANGMDVAADGTIYTTNDFGRLIAKITPDGEVDPDWSAVPSANGAVLSSDDKYLYTARTFFNPGVSRVPVNNPGQPESLVTLSGAYTFAALDGLTMDSRDRPVIPTDFSGEVLRLGPDNKLCQLANGLTQSSVVTYGHGSQGFAAGHLYRGGFDGAVYEIPAGFDPGGS